MEERDIALVVFILFVICATVAALLWANMPRRWFKKKPTQEGFMSSDKPLKPRRPLISSIELSRQDVFDAVAERAATAAGNHHLYDGHWVVSLRMNGSGAMTRAVIEFYGDEVKGKGKIWLVKG